jgi:hypothetical protein
VLEWWINFGWWMRMDHPYLITEEPPLPQTDRLELEQLEMLKETKRLLLLLQRQLFELVVIAFINLSSIFISSSSSLSPHSPLDHVVGWSVSYRLDDTITS